MTLTYPYPLATLSDLLAVKSVSWGDHRTDELSGDGAARVWQAELADPLWTAEVRLAPARADDAKRIAARIRKLHGAQEAFWLTDPLSRYPKNDPTGAVLGASTVEVLAIAGNRDRLSLTGLPAGYALSTGDKGQIIYGSSPERSFFFEFSESVTADGSGETGMVEVWPHVPAGVAAEDPVTLAEPACRMFIVPGSHNPGTHDATSNVTNGAGFRAMERRP